MTSTYAPHHRRHPHLARPSGILEHHHQQRQTTLTPDVERLRARLITALPNGFCTLPAAQRCEFRPNPAWTARFHDPGGHTFLGSHIAHRDQLRTRPRHHQTRRPRAAELNATMLDKVTKPSTKSTPQPERIRPDHRRPRHPYRPPHRRRRTPAAPTLKPEPQRAITRLHNSGQPITFTAVAKTAGVSTSFLYQHSQLRAEITSRRTQHAPNETTPSASRATVESLRTKLAAATNRNRQLAEQVAQLTTENQTLRSHLLQSRTQQPPPQPPSQPPL